MDSYKINLRDMKEADASYELTVDNSFFAHVNGPEINTGEAKVLVTVHKTIDVYELNFDIHGVIQVICDRCLDEMDLNIDTTGNLRVKLGTSFEESDDMIIIPETEGVLDISWYIYEFMALAIPLKHVHAEGECNEEMTGKLNEHMFYMEENDDETDDASNSAEREIDPRWEGLKKIMDNN